MAAKDRYRSKIVEFLANPVNDFPSREHLAKVVLGFKHLQHLYKHFSGDELQDIEKEALEIRRTRYASLLAAADKGLLKRAAEGDPAAVKLCYQKFEGWIETKRSENTGKDGGPIKHEHGISTEAQAVLDAVYGAKGGK